MATKNRKVRLPTYLVDTPAWNDYADVVAEVFDQYVDQPLLQHGSALNVNAFHPEAIQARQGTTFLSASDYTYEDVRWISKGNRIRAASMVGYTFADARTLGEDTVELLINSGAQFLPFQGKPEFVNFLNYVLNGTLDVHSLWSNELRAGAQLSTYTEDFANAAHTKTNVTVTSGVAYSPLLISQSTPTVDQIFETAVTGQHGTGRTYSGLKLNTDYAASRYLQKLDRDWAYLQLDNGTTTSRVWVNLATGDIGTNTGVSNVRVFRLGNGWYRISGSCKTTASGLVTVFFGTSITDNQVSYAGNIAYSTYEIGDQFELGISATEYSYVVGVGTNAVTETNYGVFVQEGSDNIGIPIYAGGSWFPTEHIDIDITVDPSRNVNLDNFTNFFKFVAPIHIVLRNVVYSSSFTFNPIHVSAALRMEVFDAVSNE